MKTIEELTGKTYLTTTACMSVWADGLSWANKHPEKTTLNINEAENIALLSCQVTDLAVLHDFRTMEKLMNENPGKNYFITGCLAKREDISFPQGIKRLETPRENYQPLNNLNLVNFEAPFWVKDFKEKENEKKDGHLFRYHYPLRIGKGCEFDCTYCTIKITRGDFETYDIDKRLIKEFEEHENILLIADSPTAKQINDWSNLSIKYQKPISIRNIEPQIVMKTKDKLMELSKKGLLDIFHSPVQSNNIDVLKDMHRSVNATLDTIAFAKELKNQGTYIATNIIIDYKNFKQDFSEIYNNYNYVSWNPFWDGNWNRQKAEKRFEKYLK